MMMWRGAKTAIVPLSRPRMRRDKITMQAVARLSISLHHENKGKNVNTHNTGRVNVYVQ